MHGPPAPDLHHSIWFSLLYDAVLRVGPMWAHMKLHAKRQKQSWTPMQNMQTRAEARHQTNRRKPWSTPKFIWKTHWKLATRCLQAMSLKKIIAFFSTLDRPTWKLPGSAVEGRSFENWEAWLSKSAAMEWWKASNAWVQWPAGRSYHLCTLSAICPPSISSSSTSQLVSWSSLPSFRMYVSRCFKHPVARWWWGKKKAEHGRTWWEKQLIVRIEKA